MVRRPLLLLEREEPPPLVTAAVELPSILFDVPADDDALSALARAGDGHQVYIHSIDPSSPLADLARLRDVIVRVTASVGDAAPTELETRSCSSKQARLSRGPISSRERALL